MKKDMKKKGKYQVGDWVYADITEKAAFAKGYKEKVHLTRRKMCVKKKADGHFKLTTL